MLISVFDRGGHVPHRTHGNKLRSSLDGAAVKSGSPSERLHNPVRAAERIKRQEIFSARPQCVHKP